MAIGPNVVDDCEGMTDEDYWRGMDEAMQDEEGDEPFCNCSAGHSIEEMDWNQCDSCGKPMQYQFAPKILTCDPAWEGGDDLVIGLRQGLMFRVLRVMPKNDNDVQVANLLARLEDEHDYDAMTPNTQLQPRTEAGESLPE